MNSSKRRLHNRERKSIHPDMANSSQDRASSSDVNSDLDKKNARFKIDHLSQTDYSSHPLFRRYWETQNVAQQWLQNYRQSTRYPMPLWSPIPPLSSVQHGDQQTGWTAAATSSEPAAAEPLEESSSLIEDEAAAIVEEIETKIELSDDMLAFMAQTIRHRIERDKQRALDQEIQDQTVVFVPADRPFAKSTFNEFGGDTSAVEEMLAKRGTGEMLTPLELRRQELIRLYGTEAAERIQAAETIMQMKFDQEYDRYHPPFWPNIPLKL